MDNSGLFLHPCDCGLQEKSTDTSSLPPRLTDQDVIRLEKGLNVGVCCSFLMDTVLISRDLQVMRTPLFLFAVFFFLAPGKTSTFAGKVIGGGGSESESVSAGTWVQSTLECSDTLGPGALNLPKEGNSPLLPLL